MQIILHIGQQKTASTTIQIFLAQNRKALAAKNVLYPQSTGDRKANLLNDFLSGDSGSDGSCRGISADLREEFAGKYTKAIISNENFLNLEEIRGKEALWRLKDILAPYASSWRVLAYLRRPDEHIVSQYQQKVKGGYAGVFDQFLNEQLGRPYYNYAHWLDGWADVFGEDAVEARLFHRKTLRGSPVEDFMQWCDVEPEGLSFDAPVRVKESFDPLNTEVLRFLRLCQVRHPQALHGLELKRMLDRLRALDTGDRMRLERSEAERLQAHFQADHERLAERYLPTDHASILLAPPAENTNQHQLDHDALFRRMMVLFDDQELAGLAVENAGKPADVLRGSRKLTHTGADIEARGAEARYQRQARKRDRQALQEATASRPNSVPVSREADHKASARKAASVLQRVKERLLSIMR